MARHMSDSRIRDVTSVTFKHDVYYYVTDRHASMKRHPKTVIHTTARFVMHSRHIRVIRIPFPILLGCADVGWGCESRERIQYIQLYYTADMFFHLGSPPPVTTQKSP